MPSNLDLVRSIFAAWARGDYSEADWADPAIEYAHVGEGPGSGTWSGKAAMAEGVRDWLSPWHDFRMVAEEYREIDGDRVLVLAHQVGRGKRSGLEMTFPAVSLFELRAGKVTRLCQYQTSHDRALADLGLTPERSPTTERPDPWT